MYYRGTWGEGYDVFTRLEMVSVSQPQSDSITNTPTTDWMQMETGNLSSLKDILRADDEGFGWHQPSQYRGSGRRENPLSHSVFSKAVAPEVSFAARGIARYGDAAQNFAHTEGSPACKPKQTRCMLDVQLKS
jgi:hypothetical protein